jgi:hypothetical protein
MTAASSNPPVCVVGASDWVSAFVSPVINYAASLAWLRMQTAGQMSFTSHLPPGSVPRS